MNKDLKKEIEDFLKIELEPHNLEFYAYETKEKNKFVKKLMKLIEEYRQEAWGEGYEEAVTRKSMNPLKS